MRVLEYGVLVCVLAVLPACHAQEQSLTLADNGRSEFRIVIAKDASPSVKWAVLLQ